VGRPLWDGGIAQWVEHYGIVGYLSGQSIWDSGITQWVEHYGIVKYHSG